MIYVTKHAIEQYRERILNNHSVDEEVVKKNILRVFQNSNYISDNKEGILFRDNNLMIEFIVKERKIITVYKIKLKEKEK